MPGKPASSLENNIQECQDMEQSPNEYPENVVRELTQTDQLNKKLLTSFLQRMNNSSAGFASQVDNQEQNSDTSNSTENEF